MTTVKKMGELNITQEYKTALIDCVDNFFNPTNFHGDL